MFELKLRICHGYERDDEAQRVFKALDDIVEWARHNDGAYEEYFLVDSDSEDDLNDDEYVVAVDKLVEFLKECCWYEGSRVWDFVGIDKLIEIDVEKVKKPAK